MSASVNKWELMVHDYAVRGFSIPQVAARYDIARSTARYHIKKAGKLRSRAQGVRMAAIAGRLGSGLRGKSRVFTESHCAAISTGRLKWGEENAKGFSIKPSGYIEHTRGPHKGRAVHVTNMEERLGRKILPDECVHHIDGDKLNNHPNNLALVTRSGHTRLHRFEDKISNKKRKVLANGRFS